MKLSLQDILAKEEGVCCVEEVVDEIVQRSGDVVYKHHIQRRVVPYAVMRATADMVSVVKVFRDAVVYMCV